MDQTDQLIVSLATQQRPQLTIETNRGKKYVVNLASFTGVFCFPKSQKEWEDVSISTAGYALTWGCRFEVHIDQVIAEAKTHESRQSEAIGV